MKKYVRFNGSKMKKFDLAWLLIKLRGMYVNPDHFTYLELVDLCKSHGILFDIK